MSDNEKCILAQVHFLAKLWIKPSILHQFRSSSGVLLQLWFNGSCNSKSTAMGRLGTVLINNATSLSVKNPASEFNFDPRQGHRDLGTGCLT